MPNQKFYDLGSRRSCIRELFEYGNARAKLVGRENIFDFSIGNPTTPPPKAVEKAIRDILADTPPLEIHGYTSAAGDFGARAAIAADLNVRFAAEVRPEDLFLTCGAAPALTAVLNALSAPGGQVLALAPFFPEYRVFAGAAGLDFQVVPPDPPDFQIPLEAVEARLTEHTLALILNSPNNPSGVVYTAKTLEALATLLNRKAAEFGHPIYLVSDEPYRELCYDGAEAPFVPGLYRDTVVCYSYSKSLSLPGERIGYVYVPAQAADSRGLYAAVAGAARALGHVCAPSLLQKVIARCAGVRPDLRVYDECRKLLYQGLTALGYETAKPDGAFYLFVKAPGGDSRAFSERAKKLDLLLVPGDDFGCPEYFRLSYCVEKTMIQRALPLFARLIG